MWKILYASIEYCKKQKNSQVPHRVELSVRVWASTAVSREELEFRDLHGHKRKKQNLLSVLKGLLTFTSHPPLSLFCSLPSALVIIALLLFPLLWVSFFSYLFFFLPLLPPSAYSSKLVMLISGGEEERRMGRTGTFMAELEPLAPRVLLGSPTSSQY